MIQTKTTSQWIPVSRSLKLLFTRKRLMAISFILFLSTAILTFIMYELSINFVDGLTSHYLPEASGTSSVIGWFKTQMIHLLKWLYFIFSRIIAFYLAFVLAYTLTSPGYVILSTSAEKLQAGEGFEGEDSLTLKNFFRDLVEGIKIGILGLIMTPLVLAVNFIPVFGQVAGFLLFTFYSTLMFIDYPSSRRRWHLGHKLKWLINNPRASLKLGMIPAVVSMVPIVNIFFMALLFPLLTIHTTLNFTSIVSEKDKGLTQTSSDIT